MKPLFDRNLIVRGLTITLAALAIAAAASPSAQAWTYTLLHQFCSHRCSHHRLPAAVLVPGPQGEVYGVRGGDNAEVKDSIFELVPGAHRWRYKTLYTFCKSGGSCDDGAAIYSLIGDTSGNLYGLATQGGAANSGAFFELSPNADKTEWSYRKLLDFPQTYEYEFGFIYAGEANGAPYDGVSPLFGNANSDKATFELVQTKGIWSVSTISTQVGPVVAEDPDGNLFGVEEDGYGRVFELSPNSGTWSLKVLYEFCQLHKCAAGYLPDNLLLDQDGNIFGSTLLGGRNSECADGNGCGTLFELSKADNYSYHLVHNFCSKPNCTDGANPSGSMAMDSTNTITGAAYSGYNQDAGVIYTFNGKNIQTIYGTSQIRYITRAASSNSIFGVARSGRDVVFELTP
jgi:hypothetical protein